jgi:hypothetical protein
VDENSLPSNATNAFTNRSLQIRTRVSLWPRNIQKYLFNLSNVQCFRGIVWQLLCGAHDSPVKKEFAHYIKSTSACERIIRRDIARTYPEHEFFKKKDGLGQESLFNVMKAYSLYDREVGYCQGSGFIVGLLLMQVLNFQIVLKKYKRSPTVWTLFRPSFLYMRLSEENDFTYPPLVRNDKAVNFIHSNLMQTFALLSSYY